LGFIPAHGRPIKRQGTEKYAQKQQQLNATPAPNKTGTPTRQQQPKRRNPLAHGPKGLEQGRKKAGRRQDRGALNPL